MNRFVQSDRSTDRFARRLPLTRAVIESVEARQLLSVASPAFGGGKGYASPDLNGDTGYSVKSATTAGGKIVTVNSLDSTPNTFLVTRFNADGTLDTTFSGDGSTQITIAKGSLTYTLEDVTTTADGSIFVGAIGFGDAAESVMVDKVSASGVATTLTEIGTPGPASDKRTIYEDFDLAASTNGSVYAKYYSGVGDNVTIPFRNEATIVRLDGVTNAPVESYGRLGASTFAIPGASGTVADLTVDAAGIATIVGVSRATQFADNTDVFFGTVGVDGALDSSSLVAQSNGYYDVYAFAKRANGGYVVVGYANRNDADGNVFFRAIYAAVTPTFTADATFGTGGFTVLSDRDLLPAAALTVDAAGRTYSAVSGDFAGDGNFSVAAVRLTTAGVPDASFGTGGIGVLASNAFGTDVASTTTGDVIVTAVVNGTPTLYDIAAPVVTPPPPPPPATPYTITNGTLAFVGGSGNDVVTLNKGAVAGTLVLTINGVAYTIATPVTGIAIDGGAGNDLIKVSNAITTPATLTGGAGDDTLRGGGGNDELLGGDGNDALIGRDGQDFELGGTGADYVIGSVGDDILLNGTTSLDQTGINNVMKEWTSNHNYLAKILNLTCLLPLAGRLNGNSYLQGGVTIFNDTAVDTLSGGDGADFYYAQLFGTNADVIKDNLTAFRADVASLVIGD